MLSRMSFITTPIKKWEFRDSDLPEMIVEKVVSQEKNSFFWSQGKFFVLRCAEPSLDCAWLWDEGAQGEKLKFSNEG